MFNLSKILLEAINFPVFRAKDGSDKKDINPALLQALLIYISIAPDVASIFHLPSSQV